MVCRRLYGFLDTDLKNTSCHNELDEYVSVNLYSQENQDDHG